MYTSTKRNRTQSVSVAVSILFHEMNPVRGHVDGENMLLLLVEGSEVGVRVRLRLRESESSNVSIKVANTASKLPDLPSRWAQYRGANTNPTVIVAIPNLNKPVCRRQTRKRRGRCF